MTLDERLPLDSADHIAPQPVVGHRTAFAGRVWDVVTDTVDLGAAGEVTRDYVQHPGAVAVAALRGAAGDEEILLIQQYRHPVGTYDWEIPAGLLDKPGEPARDAAARELREEADLDARDWHVLIDIFTSPGGSSENIRVFLARDVFASPATEFVREGEEAGMPTGWLPLDAAVAAVLAGRLHNGTTVAAVLAAHASRERNWTTLRAADIAWPEHPEYR